MSRKLSRRGFSLIELVIVVVIIGIIAAIAVPRMSRGADGGRDSALQSDLATLRNAIDLFETEHGGTYPDVSTIVAQLTTYSDDTGAAVAAKDSTHIYGPYIRQIPVVPVGFRKGQNGIAVADATTVGWLYDNTLHVITANCKTTDVDARGNMYSSY